MFRAEADFKALDTGSDSVLGICREYENKKLLAYFNFSDKVQSVFLDGVKSGRDLFTDDEVCSISIELKPYGFSWLLLDE